MNRYKRFTQETRVSIETGIACKAPLRTLANHLRCSASAICQEIKRNSTPNYNAKEAHKLTKLRQSKRIKPILSNKKILEFVNNQLRLRRSPEQIESLAKIEKLTVSKSSIYNYINQNPHLKRFRKHKKYRRGKTRKETQKSIESKLNIFYRPREISDKLEYGHFEIDFIIGADYSGSILTARERKTRYPWAFKVNRSSEETKKILEYLISIGAKSFTADNDSAFSCHREIYQESGVLTYFTDPASPHQKGSIEQLNKEIRVHLPKKTNFKKVTQVDIDEVIEILRGTPLKVLNWKTPKQAVSEELCLDSS